MERSSKSRPLRSKAIVVIGHGSRQGEANRQFEGLVRAYSEMAPQYRVRHGYIELAKPFMGDAIQAAAEEADEVVVAPLLLFRSGHAKNDLPLTVQECRRRFPEKSIVMADVLGVHPEMVQAAYSQAEQSGGFQKKSPSKIGIVMIGRGSSDPDANGDFWKLTRLVAEGREFGLVLPCFTAISRPFLKETLDMMARARLESIVVVPYLLFSGILLQRIREEIKGFRERYNWISTVAAEPLGGHPGVLRALADRIEQAQERRPLPCDNCRYRLPLVRQEEHVGGLRALLWSIRHRFTHNQAMPQEHSHSRIEKHVMICGDADCASQGSIQTLSRLRSELHRQELSKKIAVTRTSCMGHCSEGPTLVVYPDGIWYQRVQAENATEIIKKHLLGDSLVAHLVGDIMS